MNEYAMKLALIKRVSKLPLLFALAGVVLVLLEMFVGTLGYAFNGAALGFVISLIWLFRLRCPECGHHFVSIVTLNIAKWVKPKACQSCGLEMDAVDKAASNGQE